jgi:RimJ/RimL family protein N-acetyltransferase
MTRQGDDHDEQIHRSKRMILRKPVIEDLDDVFAIFGDPETNLFNPAGPLKTIAEAQIRLESWIEHWRRHGFGDWAISMADAPGTIIGFGGLAYLRFGEQERVNLGFRFATQAWGSGLATELGEFALQYGFGVLRFEEIWARARENHRASRRVLEKVGLKRIGQIPDSNGAPPSIVYVRKANE